MISIRRSRSEKLLSLKANPKSPSEEEALREISESISVLGSNRSVFTSLIMKTPHSLSPLTQSLSQRKRGSEKKMHKCYELETLK